MTWSRLILLLAATSSTLAFSGTYPVIAWSTYHSAVLESLPERLDSSFHKGSLLKHLAESESLCEHEAVVIVNQPGLHAADLRSLSPRAHISHSISSAPSSRQYPYVSNNPNYEHITFINRLAEQCRSAVIHHSFGGDLVIPSGYSSYVVSLSMPSLVLSGKERIESLNDHDRLLAAELSSLADLFPNHLIFLSGSPSPMTKRQEDDHPARPILDLAGGNLPFNTYANSTLPVGGILKKYQLLTPALISSLLVSIFVLLPLIFVGVKALSSIQSPIRLDTTKGVSQDRKNQ
ncbi:hypothetical protein CPB83DRAFT_858067 [Crepidotus variabilis]|uniref:Protein BIG1 n=1 Tax=Crepidotus variabilis TaxID=179855 RepID=A0A9P6ECG1_9AGAR|nr:hypothetical protein CPB83DRAFT_858067 [Crepidotus variabilis]